MTVLSTFCWIPSAVGQTPLNEAQVVERVLSRASIESLSEAEAAEARAVGDLEGAFANPELGYTREEAFGRGGTGEDYVYVSQRLDVSGRLLLRRDAGARRAGVADLTAQARRAELAARIRTAFHHALAARAREDALERWRAQIEEALETVSRRAAAGDAAPYDELRLRRELRIARARRDEMRAERRGAEAEIASLAGVSEDLVLIGRLAPGPDEIDTAPSFDASPVLRSLEELEAAADLDREASSRAWIPELLLGAGYKGVTSYLTGPDDFRSDGFTLTVGITLPIFATGSAAVARDEARARVASATFELESLTRQAEERRLLAELAGLLDALAPFDEAAGADAQLLSTASAAYEGGEASIVELLDAHRAVTEDALMWIELALTARLVVVELLLLRGEA